MNHTREKHRMKNFLKSLLFSTLLFTQFQSFAKTIIWDLGKTLVETSRFGMGCECGLGSIISCMICDHQGPSTIKNRTFDVFTSIAGKQEGNAHELTCDDCGNPLPNIMCHWLAGIKSPEECQLEALTCIAQLSLDGFFKSLREEKLLTKTVLTVFDPEAFIRNTRPIKKGVALLEKCAQTEHTNMVLSNWDSVSFNILRDSQKGQSFLRFFKPENIIVSGDIGLLKPHRSIFEYLLVTHNLDAQECIFIDDQIENVEAARACGITAIHLRNGDYKQVERELQELGVLTTS